MFVSKRQLFTAERTHPVNCRDPVVVKPNVRVELASQQLGMRSAR